MEMRLAPLGYQTFSQWGNVSSRGRQTTSVGLHYAHGPWRNWFGCSCKQGARYHLLAETLRRKMLIITYRCTHAHTHAHTRTQTHICIIMSVIITSVHNVCRASWLSGSVRDLQARDRRFDCRLGWISCDAVTLGKAFTHRCTFSTQE